MQSLHRGATEAEPAVRQREMAGLPHGGETLLGFRFFKYLFLVNLCPHFYFLWGRGIESVIYWRVYHSSQYHRVIRALVVETCREEKNKSLVKTSIIASRGERS